MFLVAATLANEARAQSWTTVGSMATPRFDYTGTLLSNGQVLVAGGLNSNGSGGYLATFTAELYDPSTGMWSATGSLTDARAIHSATLLSNGQVLVEGGGGNSANDYLTSAEVYDPITGTWSSTGSLANGRYQHTSTLLPNGKVLVVGGWNGITTLSSAELYDPSTGTWSATGLLNHTRAGHTATLLANGKVLVAAGYDVTSPLNSAELYDPLTGTWSSTGSLVAVRSSHTATLLKNGRVIVTAGTDAHSNTLASAELYDPSTGTWSSTGSLTNARTAHTATLLPNGQVLVAGGTSNRAPGGSLASAELYDPAAGTWSSTASLAFAREFQVASVLPSGQILVAAGEGPPANVLGVTEVFTPSAPPPAPAMPNWAFLSLGAALLASALALRSRDMPGRDQRSDRDLLGRPLRLRHP